MQRVIRERLIDPDYWRFWWRTRVSPDAKLLLVVALAAAAVSTYFVAQRSGDRLPAGSPGATIVRPQPALRDVDRELRQARLFELWSVANPGELERYEQYAAALDLGLRPWPPEMVTPFGRALVAAMEAASRSR